jgi:hypothetical protein
MVPQHDRQPRLIVDYSFSDVNADTPVSLAPSKKAMQFGPALQHVFSTIVHADRQYGPVYMSKIDIADGFYRVWQLLANGADGGARTTESPTTRHPAI